MKKLILTTTLALALITTFAIAGIPTMRGPIGGGGGLDAGSVEITGGTIDGVSINNSTINGATIGAVNPPEIQSTFVTVEKSADSESLSALESSNTLVTNRGWDGADDQTIRFAEAAEGLKLKFLAVVASNGTADTYFDTEGATTNIYLDGTSVGDGERIWTEEIAIGESIVCHTATLDGTNYDWFCDSVNGVWEDKGS